MVGRDEGGNRRECRFGEGGTGMSERLEVFRADGTAAGCDVERNEAHEKGILHGASHVFICRRDADGLKVLLQRRSADKDSYPGCLDTSSAGHIARGSDFLETALARFPKNQTHAQCVLPTKYPDNPDSCPYRLNGVGATPSARPRPVCK